MELGNLIRVFDQSSNQALEQNIKEFTEASAYFKLAAKSYLSKMGNSDFCVADIEWDFQNNKVTSGKRLVVTFRSAKTPQCKIFFFHKYGSFDKCMKWVNDLVPELAEILNDSGSGFLIGHDLIDEFDQTPMFSVTLGLQDEHFGVPDFGGSELALAIWLAANKMTADDLDRSWTYDEDETELEFSKFRWEKTSSGRTSFCKDDLTKNQKQRIIRDLLCFDDAIAVWKKKTGFEYQNDESFLDWHRTSFAGEKQQRTPIDRKLLVALHTALDEQFEEIFKIPHDTYCRMLSTGIGSSKCVREFYEVAKRMYPEAMHLETFELDAWSNLAWHRSIKRIVKSRKNDG